MNYTNAIEQVMELSESSIVAQKNADDARTEESAIRQARWATELLDKAYKWAVIAQVLKGDCGE